MRAWRCSYIAIPAIPFSSAMLFCLPLFVLIPFNPPISPHFPCERLSFFSQALGIRDAFADVLAFLPGASVKSEENLRAYFPGRLFWFIPAKESHVKIPARWLGACEASLGRMHYELCAHNTDSLVHITLVHTKTACLTLTYIIFLFISETSEFSGTS